jgi:hypothetical protein
MPGQADQVRIGRIDQYARGIGVVVQKLMEPELHNEPAQAIGGRRDDLGLDVGEGPSRDLDVLFLGRCLYGFKGFEPLHE